MAINQGTRTPDSTSGGIGSLTAASLVSGVGAYLVIALGTRAVGEVLFAPVSVLWSLWALTAAAISFPVQHWAIRTTETEGEATVWAAVPRLVGIAIVLSLASGAASLALGPRLYATSSVSFSIMTALLPLGSLLLGLERGLLAHRKHFRTVALTIGGENVLRAVLAAGVLVWGDGNRGDAALLGWIIVAGFVVTLLRADVLVPPRDRMRTHSASMRLLGGFAGANVAAQATLTSGPVVLALLRAPEATITQVFAILALLRVPYTGIVGASAAITGPLTRVSTSGRAAELRRWEVRAAVATVVLAGLAAVVAPLLLPPIVAVMFATTVTISSPAQGLLAAGGVVAVAGLLEMLMLLARHRPRHLLSSWALGGGAGATCLLLPVSPVSRVCIAFLVAEGVALTAMVSQPRLTSG